MKVATIKFSDVDGILGDFDKTYQEYKYVRELVNILNDCIVDTSCDCRNIETLKIQEAIKISKLLISTLKNAISDDIMSRKLLDIEVIGNYIKEENNIVEYVLSTLDEYKYNIDRSLEMLRNCNYRYNDLCNVLVEKKNYLFCIGQRLERYKDYSLYDVIAAVCDAYENIITSSTTNTEKIRSNTKEIFKFVVWLRNLLVNYSNDLNFSTYADNILFEE